MKRMRAPALLEQSAASKRKFGIRQTKEETRHGVNHSSTLYTIDGVAGNGGGNGRGNGHHSPLPITGRNIAHSDRSAAQRAAVAAKLRHGLYWLEQPTILQLEAITRVSQP